MIKNLSLFVFLLMSFITNAQETAPQMADSLRADGKIYIVITVMAVIFVCVAAYLFIIDRKVKRLEDELKNKKP